MRLARRAFTLLGLATAAGAVFTGYQAQARVRAAEAAFPPLGDFVDIGGSRMHYVQAGKGPDVVLLHGAGGNLREFSFDLMDRLSDRYRVTVFDRPGMGYSDRLPVIDTSVIGTEGESPAQQATALRTAAERLGISRPIVGGHSFGGIVAMAWAQAGDAEPDALVNARAVVSLAGVLMPWPGDLGLYYRLNASAFGGAVTIPLISAFAADTQIQTAIDGIFYPQSPPDGYAAYVGGSLTLRPGQFRANVRQVNGLLPHVKRMAARYPDLTLPIEIVHGDLDTTVPITVHPHELVKIVPSANLTTLGGVGHMPHHADPAATVAAFDRAADRAGLR